MSVPQQRVIDTIREQCELLDDRYPGYAKDLIGYLAEVLAIERESPHNVKQQIEAQLKAFGDLYHHRRITGGEAAR